MESGSVIIHKGGKEKRYDLCIEDYVISYLKREADSLEVSKIFFYGSRKDGGRKLLVYGAGREKEIAAFAQYELLDELLCRLTQAGPAFLIREKNGDYEVKGFKIFYADNEAMQQYLIQWHRDGEEDHIEEQPVRLLPEASAFHAVKKKTPQGTISVQLCLILVVLTAIVIGSANSYDKMNRLNQSAKEVFFAIENQEAEEAPDSFARQPEAGTEIVVERDTMALQKRERAEPDTAMDTPVSEQGTDSETEETPKEVPEEIPEETPKEMPEEISEETPEEGVLRPAVEASEKETVEPEENEEALSRNVTRYYEVERGDTLYTISQKIYGDTSRVEKICELNQITDPDRIRYGQKIILP